MASVGGKHEYTFVEQPSKLKLFECALCNSVLREPQLTACCGRNVCLQCLGDYNRTHKPPGLVVSVWARDYKPPCPLCNGILSAVLNRHLKNEISELKVRCPLQEHGCTWEGRLELLHETHENECDYADIDCPYDCGDHFQRRKCEDHLKTCEKFVVPCPNDCGLNFERCLLSQHVTECPNSIVECPLGHVGCKAEMKRKDIATHIQEDFSCHVAMVAERNREARTRGEEMRDTMGAERGEKLKQKEDEIAFLATEIGKSEEKANTLLHLLEAAEKEICALKAKQRDCKKSIEQEIMMRDAEIRALQDGVTDLQRQARVRCFGPPLPEFVQCSSRPTPPATKVYIVPAVFTLENFQKKKADEAQWHGPPFYTHQGGYKMVLFVHPNGFGDCHSKWVSVFIKLIRGEYDQYLRWPFIGNVVVEIKNQKRDKLHEMQSIAFDKNCGQRITDGYMSSHAAGHHRFMSQALLHPGPFSSRQFLKNDCLKIRISEVTITPMKAAMPSGGAGNVITAQTGGGAMMYQYGQTMHM